MNDESSTCLRRTNSPGLASVWTLWLGPRFLIEMNCYGYGRHLTCWVDGSLNDETHLIRGPRVRRWIRGCWTQHLESLTGHERMEYVEMGLLEETD
jgi:hypothetical protein